MSTEVTPANSSEKSQDASAWNLANVLTIVRLALVPLFADLLMQSQNDRDSAYQAAYVFILASATDLADGVIARKFNLVTNFGKIADPIADKALIGTALIGLSMMNQVPWFITVAILVREIGITLIRLRLIRRAVIPASRGGKVKTVSQIIAITLVIIPLPHVVSFVVTASLWFALVMTLATGVDYLMRAATIVKSSSLTGSDSAVPHD